MFLHYPIAVVLVKIPQCGINKAPPFYSIYGRTSCSRHRRWLAQWPLEDRTQERGQRRRGSRRWRWWADRGGEQLEDSGAFLAVTKSLHRQSDFWNAYSKLQTNFETLVNGMKRTGSVKLGKKRLLGFLLRTWVTLHKVDRSKIHSRGKQHLLKS